MSRAIREKEEASRNPNGPGPTERPEGKKKELSQSKKKQGEKRWERGGKRENRGFSGKIKLN